MKNYFNILLGILSCVGLFACSNEELNEGTIEMPENSEPVNNKGRLWDGHDISQIGLYCIEKDSSVKIVIDVARTYWVKTKTIKDYSDMDYMYLLIDTDRDWDSLLHRYGLEKEEDRRAVAQKEAEYYKNKSSLLIEDYDAFDYDADPNRYWYRKYDYVYSWFVDYPAFYTAYVNGEVSITCDKTLYGEESGTNLSKHFGVISPGRCVPVGIENVRLLHHFGEVLPTDMEEIFPHEAWLHRNYFMYFKDIPSEKYDNLTLHLSIPMTVEHSMDYIVSEYKGNAPQNPRYTETVFEADCPINFNWD